MWRDNGGFDEVLISKRMVQDHMPDKVLEALEKVQYEASGWRIGGKHVFSLLQLLDSSPSSEVAPEKSSEQSCGLKMAPAEDVDDALSEGAGAASLHEAMKHQVRK